MRVAILWSATSGYLNACLRQLHASGNQVFLASSAPSPEAPFAREMTDWIHTRFEFVDQPDTQALLSAIANFDPDIVLTSWDRKAYRAVCRAVRGRALRVCCMDHQWRGTAKQWAGVLSSPFYIQRLFDRAFVAGERQARFARRLGFADRDVWRGVYSCDFDAFHAAYLSRQRLQPRFLFVGRLAPEKNVDVLLSAYDAYRSEAPDPWPLHIAGAGSLQSTLASCIGVVYEGFRSPEHLPALFAEASTFILPSRYEPWGVVIHEAAAAGLPIICTSECGASDKFVRDGVNGVLIAPDSVEQLKEAMKRMSSLTAQRLAAMSAASAELGAQITPAKWVQTIVAGSIPPGRSRATHAGLAP